MTPYPRSRLYGRWITHVWVWIETLSLQLKDSMCGFRVYPVWQRRLSCAIAALSASAWTLTPKSWSASTGRATPSRFILPTRVTYPQSGVSHFDALKDNVRISLMHTRLFFGMLPRIPGSCYPAGVSRRTGQRRQSVKGLWGMRLMLRVWQLLGPPAVYRAAVAGDRRLLAQRASGAAGVAAVADARTGRGASTADCAAAAAQQLFPLPAFRQRDAGQSRQLARRAAMWTRCGLCARCARNA